MPANVYECMFLLDTTKVSGDVQGAATRLHEILEKNEAEILASRPWDERRLAYPVNRQRKGLYYLMYFRVDGNRINPIEADLKLNEMVLRSMILKIDPKLVDLMLQMAQDEHAVALQTVQDDSDDL